MALPNELHPLQLGAGSASAYQIEQSLRLNKTDQSYVNKVFTSAGDEQKFTLSFWFKICQISKSTADNLAGAGADGNNYFNIDIEKSSVGEFLHIFNYTPAHGYEFDLKTNRAIRDPSAWMHLVLAVDTTQATESDRVKVWLNGVRETSFATENYPAQNRSNLWWGGNTTNGTALSSQETAFGRRPPGGPEYANAYIAEAHSIDGQYLTHEDFGEYDVSGVWRPIRYTGTYGTNGFYLKFDPSATNGIGHDHSGNGNNFTANNFTTSGTGTDVVSDTPTSNFATLNPLIGYQTGGLKAPVFSNGNLTVAPQVDSSNNSRPATPTLARSPGNGGVWRWELVVNNNANSSYGIMALDGDTGAGGYGPWWSASGLAGTLGVANGASGSLQEQHATISAGDVITIVVSFDDNEIGWYINGIRTGFYNNCNFSNYDQLVPFCKESTRTQTPCTFDVNFGQKAFQYTTSGDAWGDLSLLPAPTIKDGSDYFNTVLYTGNGTTDHAITGVGFQPDFVWGKRRDGAFSHGLFDSIRGGDKRLVSNLTNAEDTLSEYIKSFDADGFTLGNDANLNFNTASMVAWNWLEGASQGFDIISYTGNGVNGRSIAHSLGVTPAFIIVKNRDSAEAWAVWHQGLGSAIAWLTFTTAAAGSASAIFGGGANEQLPDSTNFYIGSNGMVNANGDNYIAYCFAEVEGYSKFGSYTGNGSSDGPFVYCGFKPSFVLFKSTGSSTNWTIIDSARSTYNPAEAYLKPNASQAETNLLDIDMLSNGFKLRGTSGGDHNQSSTTFIFAAFAENPFGGDGVSPATAR